MSSSKNPIKDIVSNPPTKPSQWLSEVANKTFFLCYDNARMEYNRQIKQQGAFEQLTPKEQGALCAQAMNELVTRGYTSEHGEEIYDMASDQHRSYQTAQQLERLGDRILPNWTYEAE